MFPKYTLLRIVAFNGTAQRPGFPVVSRAIGATTEEYRGLALNKGPSADETQ